MAEPLQESEKSGYSLLLKVPYFSSLASAAVPVLAIIFIALAESLTFAKRFSSSIQTLFVWRFGSKRVRTWLFAWDTVLPYMGLLPVSKQTLDMVQSIGVKKTNRNITIVL